MEEKLAKQFLNGFADSRLNTAHLAWIVQTAANDAIHEKIEEFIYFYMTFQGNLRHMPHVTQKGDSVTIVLDDPLGSG